MELNEIIKTLSAFGNDQPVPKEALAEAARQKEAITPLLMDAAEHIYNEVCTSGEDACDDPVYDLSLYSVFLLAQFREQKAFPILLKMLTLDSDRLEIMLGDVVSNSMNHILYSTYNGDLGAVKDVITDDRLDPFARIAALYVLDGLFRDGRLSRDDLITFLRERLAALGDSDDEWTFGGLMIPLIGDNDLYELVEDVREAYRRETIDTQVLGDFDEFFDFLYADDGERSFNHTSVIEDTARELETWACFKSETPSKWERTQELLSWNVGRNDPCPCGSGKKFKKCCLPKRDQLQLERSRRPEMESDNYPAVERQGDRPGLSDHYSHDAIQIDRLAYQGMCMLLRPTRRQRKERRKTIAEARKLLWCAFEEFQKICARDGLKTLDAYDQGYKMHYLCSEWLEVLRDLLKNTGDQERYQEVMAVLTEMRPSDPAERP